MIMRLACGFGLDFWLRLLACCLFELICFGAGENVHVYVVMDVDVIGGFCMHLWFGVPLCNVVLLYSLFLDSDLLCVFCDKCICDWG